MQLNAPYVRHLIFRCDAGLPGGGSGCLFVFGNNLLWIALVILIFCEARAYPFHYFYSFWPITSNTYIFFSCTRALTREVGAACAKDEK